MINVVENEIIHTLRSSNIRNIIHNKELRFNSLLMRSQNICNASVEDSCTSNENGCDSNIDSYFNQDSKNNFKNLAVNFVKDNISIKSINNKLDFIYNVNSQDNKGNFENSEIEFLKSNLDNESLEIAELDYMPLSPKFSINDKSIIDNNYSLFQYLKYDFNDNYHIDIRDDDNVFFSQLVNDIELIDDNSINFQLEPDTLGKLSIYIKLDDKNISKIEVFSESQEVIDRLSKEDFLLWNSLKGIGVEVDDIVFDVKKGKSNYFNKNNRKIYRLYSSGNKNDNNIDVSI